MSTNSNSHHYDTLVIGAGLTGLLIARRLREVGQRVALLEARDVLGGSGRRKASVEFFPATNENLELIEWLKSQSSSIPLESETREHQPRIFDEGKWRPFAGFGDSAFQSVGELSLFGFTQELCLNPCVEHVVEALCEQPSFTVHTLSEVTSIQISDDMVSAVVVNGDKHYSGDNVIFTPYPGLLNNLVEGEGLAAKSRTRLAKMNGWTSVALELHHTPPLHETSEVQVFVHSAKEFEPVVGRIFGERSIWMTLVPDDREGDHEFVGQCIRHIKRQLKRAWPDRLDGPMQEKIFVQPEAFGQQSFKGKDTFRFQEIANLWLANHLLASQPGALGSLEMARGVLEKLPIANVQTQAVPLRDERRLKELPELGAPC